MQAQEWMLDREGRQLDFEALPSSRLARQPEDRTAALGYSERWCDERQDRPAETRLSQRDRSRATGTGRTGSVSDGNPPTTFADGVGGNEMKRNNRISRAKELDILDAHHIGHHSQAGQHQPASEQGHKTNPGRAVFKPASSGRGKNKNNQTQTSPQWVRLD